MGLDAVVYRSRKNLSFDAEISGASLDPRTGEYFFHDISTERRFKPDDWTDLHRRLGNVDSIARVSAAIERSLGRNSLLQDKVLFSGTHAGDVIELEKLEQLRTEIAELRRSPITHPTPELAHFIQCMEDLVAAALAEQNPIVLHHRDLRAIKRTTSSEA